MKTQVKDSKDLKKQSRKDLIVVIAVFAVMLLIPALSIAAVNIKENQKNKTAGTKSDSSVKSENKQPAQNTNQTTSQPATNTNNQSSSSPKPTQKPTASQNYSREPLTSCYDHITAYKTVRIADSNMRAGQEVVKTEGVNGVKEMCRTTYYYADGSATDSSSERIKQVVVDKVIYYGTSYTRSIAEIEACMELNRQRYTAEQWLFQEAIARNHCSTPTGVW